jgi:hypothetical protein
MEMSNKKTRVTRGLYLSIASLIMLLAVSIMSIFGDFSQINENIQRTQSNLAESIVEYEEKYKNLDYSDQFSIYEFRSETLNICFDLYDDVISDESDVLRDEVRYLSYECNDLVFELSLNSIDEADVDERYNDLIIELKEILDAELESIDNLSIVLNNSYSLFLPIIPFAIMFSIYELYRIRQRSKEEKIEENIAKEINDFKSKNE